MNREIKFRGKRIKAEDPLERWIEGSYIEYTNIHNDKIIRIVSKSGYQNEVHIDTIGQFTGLHDKNGKEIYEGDIIKFHFMTSSPSSSELFPTKKFFGEITTNKYNQWTILSDGLEIHIENAIKYGEIIGNIYDNKELLEG